jgi:ribose transport system permease protein
MLQSIAAAVIGGVSLRGGEGRVMQAVNGALFITVLTVGMNFLRISGYTQTVVLGVVVIVAILLDRPRTRLR